ncbi:hypothetical protein SAMN04490205_4222 [Pseudomonas trivialis]|nr:hypothetical protein SAMN04490205_4222 [Pseudomonas trivialis]
MAVLSGASAIVLNEAAYLRKLDPVLKAEVSRWSLLLLTAAVVLLNVLIARGHNWAAGWLAGYFAVCLMSILPTLDDCTHRLAFSSGVVFSLLGLLLLNTDWHREMRHACREMRAQRALARAMYKRFSDNLKAKTRRARQQ